ncbi:hypothetical protein PanWU01x14_369650 [Parasponia andersonii]|uniref:Uncharacterized protein n=1 Tax=Parasponia andersonii TaxID=3476 RepID=A0A2P5A4J0_PARAD|nr:hypothetical protein PanWU01x14_369650 [Parasponia andersonii]
MNTQICTLGFGKKVSSWRPITCVPPRPLPLTSVAVLAGGFLHWVTVALPERCVSVEEALNKHKQGGIWLDFFASLSFPWPYSFLPLG